MRRSPFRLAVGLSAVVVGVALLGMLTGAVLRARAFVERGVQMEVTVLEADAEGSPYRRRARLESGSIALPSAELELREVKAHPHEGSSVPPAPDAHDTSRGPEPGPADELLVTSREPLEPGDRVQVLVLEEAPTHALAGTPRMSLLDALALEVGVIYMGVLGLGGIFSLVGGIALLLPRRLLGALAPAA